MSPLYCGSDFSLFDKKNKYSIFLTIKGFFYASSMKLMNSGELTFLRGGILKFAILFNVSKKFAVLLL